MKLTRRVIYSLIPALMAMTSCTDQRDLYVEAPSMVLVKTDWKNSTTPQNLWTAMFYNGKKYQLTINQALDSISIENGSYRALTVNGSLGEGIPNVLFRSTGEFDTFEAVATNAQGSMFSDPLMSPVVNSPDTLYGSSVYQEIKGDEKFYLKYQNGKNGFYTPISHLGDTVTFVPQRLTYKVNVIATIHQFQHAAKNTYVIGNQSGFAPSVFVGTGLPSHNAAFYEYRFKQSAADAGQTYVTTASYNSFGPPLDIPNGSRSYFINLKLILRDGKPYTPVFNVTSQVETIISQIKNTGIHEFTLRIETTLPRVDGNENVGVDPWGDDKVIIVPVN